MSSLTGFTRMKSPVSLLCSRRVTKCEQNLQTVFSWALCKELCGKCSLEGTLGVHRSAWKHSRYFEDTLKILWSYSENVQAFERFRARAQSVRLQSSTVIARWQADEWSVPWQRSHCSRAVWPGCRDMWWQIGLTTARIIPNIYIVYIYKYIKMYMYIINNKYVY